jgi:hypothetical protein
MPTNFHTNEPTQHPALIIRIEIRMDYVSHSTRISIRAILGIRLRERPGPARLGVLPTFSLCVSTL